MLGVAELKSSPLRAVTTDVRTGKARACLASSPWAGRSGVGVLVHREGGHGGAQRASSSPSSPCTRAHTQMQRQSRSLFLPW